MVVSTDEEPTTPVSSPQGGGGRLAFCPFHQAMKCIHSIVADPSAFEETKTTLEIALSNLFGDPAGSSVLPPPASGSSGTSGSFTPKGLAPSACCTPEEQITFMLSVAFNCPHAEISAMVRASLRHAVRASIVDDSFLALLRESTVPADTDVCDCVKYELDGWPISSVGILDGDWTPLPPSLAVPHLRASPSFRSLLDAPDYSALMARVFADESECSNYAQILSSFPPVLLSQHNTWHFLLSGDGPLPIEERLLVAIMAASRHICEYVTRRLLVRALLTPSFPRAWLQGILPAKFIAFGKVIATLAHKPWSVNAQLIALLFASEATDSSGDVEPWNVPSIVQAVCIASTVMAQCGFVVMFQIPFEPLTAALPADLGEPRQLHRRSTATKAKEGIPSYSGVPFERFRTDDDVKYEERIKRELSAKEKARLAEQKAAEAAQTAALAHSASDEQVADAAQQQQPLSSSPPQPSSTPPSTPATSASGDGKEKEKDVPSLQYSRFSWDFNASPMIDNHFVGFVQCFEEERAAYVQIVSSLDASEIRYAGPDAVAGANDDEQLWRSIGIYIHNLFGVTHSDFNYATMNRLLTREAKNFVQKVTALPEATVVDDVVALKVSDPVMYVILAVGATLARREAILLHFMFHLAEFLKAW